MSAEVERFSLFKIREPKKLISFFIIRILDFSQMWADFNEFKILGAVDSVLSLFLKGDLN
jgi:hypothetical protein